jgi:uncharacterized protein DUF6600/FecR-like protein
MPRTTLLPASALSLALLFCAASFGQSSSSSQSNPTNVSSESAQSSADQFISDQVQENEAQASSPADQSGDANAYSHARIVRLSYVDGDVRIDRGDNQGFIKAFSNMPLVEGSRLWTEAEGRAEAEFEDGSTIRLTPNSMLSFKQLQLGKNGERLTTVSLDRGEAYFGIKKRSDDQFIVSLNPESQRLQVKKDSHFRVTADSSGVKVAEFTGALELIKPDEHIDVGKNESLTLDAADPQRYFLAHGTAADPLDSWDRERDQQEAMTVTNQNLGYNAVYNTAMYSYGYEDLARYGNYIYEPGFGYVWRPYYESAYWDPFQNGAWMWYPQYNNYVFVSAYPWGWRPFHYGSWVNVPGVGWCWRPGRNTNFVPVTGVVNPPPGFRPIHPPRPGHGIVVPIGQGFATNVNGTVQTHPGMPLVNGTRQGAIVNRMRPQGGVPPVIATPNVRPVPAVNPVRIERPTRIEPVRPMPAPVRAPSAPAMRPMSTPPRMAPMPMPSAPAVHGDVARPRGR